MGGVPITIITERNTGSRDGAADAARNAGAESGRLKAADLATLMTLFSPAFPTGGFAYSHGVEAAVRGGRVTNGNAVFDWIGVVLSRGSGWNDLVLLAEAHRLTRAADGDGLLDLAELAFALSGSAERRMETLKLGTAFREAASSWTKGRSLLPTDAEIAMPVAAGEVTALAGLPLRDALTAHAQNFAASLTSAAVRLVPLGQGEWVAVLHALAPLIAEAAERAAGSTLDDLGSAALMSDIAAMQHETLETRLFRS
ncbi:urease accessory protein UreF [Jiella marina]|uniref:urease accessory protein UreF n=1 Tax=Jiella sp. LLJ827 TaxID=2917712 RepID=UPI002101C3C4|nr:urease accessory protein UreF [Jiella sp. LLJ827]MCQ0988265.1 urease accessory protein UreF [Jiella sp. LLJ827]